MTSAPEPGLHHGVWLVLAVIALRDGVFAVCSLAGLVVLASAGTLGVEGPVLTALVASPSVIGAVVNGGLLLWVVLAGAQRWSRELSGLAALAVVLLAVFAGRLLTVGASLARGWMMSSVVNLGSMDFEAMAYGQTAGWMLANAVSGAFLIAALGLAWSRLPRKD